MKIFLNEKPADITLDSEKTLGDVLSGIEQWVSPAGNRIRKISIDGKNIPVEDLGAAFGRELNDIERLDITVSSYRELAAEALNELAAVCVLFAEAPFEERSKIASNWENSPAAEFMSSSLNDIFELASVCFSGKGLSPADLAVLLTERLREIVDPQREIANCEPLLKKIAQRMEELPLDMQTGKDEAAADTINLFSKMGEKLFRILLIYKSEGLSLESFTPDNLPGQSFLEEFNTALTDISQAYRDKDTVLAGDIAEYELAPRILLLFNALKEVNISTIDITQP